MRLLSAATATGLVVVLHVHATLPRHVLADDLARQRALASLVRTAGAITWPLCLLSVVPADDHGRPALAIPLAWNGIMWAIDAQLLHRAPSNDPHRPASLRLDPGCLTSLAFGLCAMLGGRPESKHTHLFMYAIVGCLVLVLPSHNLQPGCFEEQLFESAQKAALLWCVGLLIAGITLTRLSIRDGAPGAGVPLVRG